jgi:hypothetical protein
MPIFRFPLLPVVPIFNAEHMPLACDANFMMMLSKCQIMNSMMLDYAEQIACDANCLNFIKLFELSHFLLIMLSSRE